MYKQLIYTQKKKKYLSENNVFEKTRRVIVLGRSIAEKHEKQVQMTKCNH